jgi:hypothetical protein
MNALAKTAQGGVPATYANPWAQAGSGAGSSVFMKFKGASGDFLAGPDEEEVPHGSTFVADFENSKWSWSFWYDGEVLETVDTFIKEDPNGYDDDNEPDYLPEKYDGTESLEEIREQQKADPANYREGWSVQAVIGLREIGGESTEYTLKLGKGVALNSFRAVLPMYGKQVVFKEGLLPVLELSARSYKSKIKSVGKRYAPNFKITEWISELDLMNAASGDDAEYDDEPTPPKARTETKALPKADAEGAPAEEAPAAGARRGRRGASY